MRKVMIGLTVGLTFAGCDRTPESLPDEMPAARIAPEAPSQTAAQEAQSDEAEAAPAAAGKGAGAAGCATAECEAACEGESEPECAEAYAIGCFSDAPPDDSRCEAFAAPVEKAKEVAPKTKKASDGDSIDAKATPVGD